MIDIQTLEIAGWMPAIESARNSYKSTAKTDSYILPIEQTSFITNDGTFVCKYKDKPVIGEEDYKLLTSLCKGRSSHCKFKRMIDVYIRINAPLYWWKQFDTYKVGMDQGRESTMHTIMKKPLDLGDFTHTPEFSGLLYSNIVILNDIRSVYMKCSQESAKSRYWETIISLLPECYNQRGTVKVNYETLTHIYHDRKDHKLGEWHDFCDWIEQLPYSEFITNKKSVEEITTEALEKKSKDILGKGEYHDESESDTEY